MNGWLEVGPMIVITFSRAIKIVRRRLYGWDSFSIPLISLLLSAASMLMIRYLFRFW